MNDNYLWDRTGEPDPEVQKLEEILGTLRYQPRPLESPPNIRPWYSRTILSGLAIAAAIALMTIASGLWFHFRQQRSAQSSAADRERKPPVNQPAQVSPHQISEIAGIDNQTIPASAPHRQRARNSLAYSKSRHVTAKVPELTAQEAAEKEQVLLALRLVSAKLNVAQRRTQGAPALNTIRNQHKIG